MSTWVDTFSTIVPPASPLFEADSLSKLELQEKEDGRIQIVASTPGLRTTHDTAIRFETRTGDALSEVEEDEEPPVTRAEAYIDPSRFPESVTPGARRIYRGIMQFPEDFDVTAVGFRTLVQIKHSDESGAAAALYMFEGTDLHWNDITGPVVATIVPGGSIDWMIEAFWAEDAGTSTQRIYINGELKAESNEVIKPGGVYVKFGYYKAASVPTGAYEHIGFVIGASLSAVGL